MNGGESFNPYLRPAVRRLVRASTELSASAKLTYEALADHAGKDGRCYPSVATIAADVGVKHRQAQRYVQELVDRGYCRSCSAFDDNGRQTSNWFEFLWRPEFELELRVSNTTPSRTY